jgi:Ca2+-binding EF-hand superfamily protein
MIRRLYCLTLRLHPARFRREFAEEMLWIFDQAATAGRRMRFLGDGLLSLVRQWALREDYGEAAAEAGAPMFQSIAPLHLRPAVLCNAALAAMVSLGFVAFAVTSGAKTDGKGRIVLREGEPLNAPVFYREGAAEAAQEALPLREPAATHVAEPRVEHQSRPRIEYGGYFSILPVLRTLDADNDRSLSTEEIAAAPDRLRLLDRSHDGALNGQECGFRLGYGSSSPSRYMRVHAVHRVLDANGDGVISAEEIAASAERLRALDANRDGRIDVGELLRR